MRLTPNDIVEALVDELVTGELGEQHDSLRLSREAPGVLMLDYGKAGRFRLEVTSADTSRTLGLTSAPRSRAHDRSAGDSSGLG